MAAVCGCRTDGVDEGTDFMYFLTVGQIILQAGVKTELARES